MTSIVCRNSHRNKHVALRIQMSSQVALQYAVLPPLMGNHQPELCPCYVSREGHEFLSRCELVELGACEIVRSLCHWKSFLYQVLGDTLHVAVLTQHTM